MKQCVRYCKRIAPAFVTRVRLSDPAGGGSAGTRSGRRRTGTRRLRHPLLPSSSVTPTASLENEEAPAACTAGAFVIFRRQGLSLPPLKRLLANDSRHRTVEFLDFRQRHIDEVRGSPPSVGEGDISRRLAGAEDLFDVFVNTHRGSSALPAAFVKKRTKNE